MLARAYLANGQVKEAVSLLEQVVKIREQTLAEDHPEQLSSQHELARAYLENRQVEEAASLFEKIAQIEDQNPSRGSSRSINVAASIGEGI